MQRKNLPIMAAAILLVSALSWSQQSPATAAAVEHDPTTEAAAQAAATGVAFSERNPRYRLCSGDVFDISFEFSPEFDQQGVAIQPDGFVTLKGIGDIKASGQTVPELTQTLKNAYGRILAEPVITVVLKDFNKPYFIATGFVSKPGKYDLRADTTVTEAVAIAGGFIDGAKHSQVLLFRRVKADLLEAKEIDVKDMLSKKSLREDMHLQPGDMVYVPQNKISKVRRYIPMPGMNIPLNPASF
jgi:polysaccharide export outer membrane protein